MFTPVIQALANSLSRINALRYINNIVVGKEGDTGSFTIWVTRANASLGDEGDLTVPVYRPPLPPGPTDDYRPLQPVPLVLRLFPRVVIPAPPNNNYDPTVVALACVHALSYTDGALANFMAQDHALPLPSSPVANPNAYVWATYRLETLKIIGIVPMGTAGGMEIQLKLEGSVWLHPPAEPPPVPIAEVILQSEDPA